VPSSSSAATRGDQPAEPISNGSSTVTVPAQLTPEANGTSVLESTALRPGTAARRLQAEEIRRELYRKLPETFSFGYRLRRHGVATLRYLLQTEVHTYAFSYAAYSLLSFFPLVVLLLTVSHRVLHSQEMYDAAVQMLRDYVPSNKDFVVRNLQFLASVRGRGQVLSLVMLVITASGIFLPLEVALNSVWGFKKNRSYLMNLVLSVGLALALACLAMFSVYLTARNQHVLGRFVGDGVMFDTVEFVILRISALVLTVSVYFLVYWLLPNGKVPLRAVLPAAIVTGVLTEAAKYLYILVLPWLNFQEVYGPFAVSVTLIFWSYWTGMLLLGGAYFSAAEYSDRVQARRETAAAS
jgi:YihY family inner membrane protein